MAHAALGGYMPCDVPRIDVSRATTDEYREFMLKLVSMIRRKEVEELLAKKLREAKSEKPRVERRNTDRGDVFRVRAYILATDVSVESFEGVAIPLRIVTNGTMVAKNGVVELYYRLGSLATPPLGCWNDRTFIGYSRVGLDELRGRVRLASKPVLYPLLSMECTEDPRIDPDDPMVMTHVRGHYRFWKLMDMHVYVLTMISRRLDDGSVTEIEPVAFRWVDGSLFLYRDYRDTFPLNSKFMVTRPWIEELDTGVPFVGPREWNVVEAKELRTWPELVVTSDEVKTGGNCSAKLSSNEYLVLFHSVDRYFGCYYTYAAVFSSDGELLGVSPEPVISPKPRVFWGTRPSTVFACGIQVVKDRVLVSAGKDDEVLLILEASLDELISKIRFFKG